MKKSGIIAGMLALLVIGGGAAFAIGGGVIMTTETESNVNTNSAATNATEGTHSQPTVAEADPVVANYIDYEEGIIESTPGTKVVYFHADWCVTCNALQNDVFENGIREDVTFIKADYDTEDELRERYNVTFQTFTVLVDDEGNMLDSHYAGVDPRVEAVLEAFQI